MELLIGVLTLEEKTVSQTKLQTIFQQFPIYPTLSESVELLKSVARSVPLAHSQSVQYELKKIRKGLSTRESTQPNHRLLLLRQTVCQITHPKLGKVTSFGKFMYISIHCSNQDEPQNLNKSCQTRSTEKILKLLNTWQLS